jgi:CBS domain-containing protein
MKVRDVMTSDVVTVGPETSLKEVATTLLQHRISGLPVVDEKGEVLGVVSEGDILSKERGMSEQKGLLAWFLDPNWTKPELKLEARTAGEAMTSPAKTIASWRPVSAAAAEMLDEAVNRLPVVDDDGRLVGIVTRADLVRAFARPDAEIAREIRQDVLERALMLETPESVTVTVENGRVTLAGSVTMRTDAELAATLVAKVPGVVEIDSRIDWREDNTKTPTVSPLVLGTRRGS